MSADEKVAKDLVETLKDGQKGFITAADKLGDSDHPEGAETLRRISQQRGQFAQEIIDLGHRYDDDVDESGSALAAVHRGWVTLKDAVTGDNAAGVLGAAISGEDHAVSEYEKALGEDLSDGFRAVVERQHGEVLTARDEVKAMQTVV